MVLFQALDLIVNDPTGGQKACMVGPTPARFCMPEPYQEQDVPWPTLLFEDLTCGGLRRTWNVARVQEQLEERTAGAKRVLYALEEVNKSGRNKARLAETVREPFPLRLASEIARRGRRRVKQEALPAVRRRTMLSRHELFAACRLVRGREHSPGSVHTHTKRCQQNAETPPQTPDPKP